MANRKRQAHDDYAETEVLPAHPIRLDAQAEAEEQGRYQEYLRSLEEVPVLVDVVREPALVVVKDFRLGQRRDERKSPRDDSGELREQREREREQQYAEYVAICAGLVSTKRAGPRKTARKTSHESGAQKKRAKRTKRSARSKS